MPSYESPYYGTVHYTYRQALRSRFMHRVFYPVRMWIWETFLRHLPGGRCPECQQYKQFKHEGLCAPCEWSAWLDEREDL